MRKVIAVVPVAMVAGFLALSGSGSQRTSRDHPHAQGVPDAPVPVPVATALAVQAGVGHAVEQAHVAAAAAQAAAAVTTARTGSAQVHVAADAHAAVSVSLEGLVEILVQELERSAMDGSEVELRNLEISLSALTELAAELEGMADIRVGDSTVTIVSSPDGARVRVHVSAGASER